MMKPPCRSSQGAAARVTQIRTRVEIDHRLDMLVARLKRVDPSEHQAGVVDEAVETAYSACSRLGDDLRARLRVRDVAFDRQRFAARGLDLAHKRVSLFGARLVTDRDPRPLLGEASRDGGPHPRRTAGDQDSFAGEIGNDETGSGHKEALLLLFSPRKCRRRRARLVLDSRRLSPI